jgi:hypothetical protein
MIGPINLWCPTDEAIGFPYPLEWHSIKLMLAAWSEVVLGTYRALFATGFLFLKEFLGRHSHPSA